LIPYYALPLHIEQTPASFTGNETRLTQYAKQVEKVLGTIPATLHKQIVYVVGDAYYTKKDLVDTVINAGKYFVGKLRRDANLRLRWQIPQTLHYREHLGICHLKYLYQGKPTGKAGRPKQFEGKVDFKDFTKWQEITNTETLCKYSQILYHLGLKRRVQVVCFLHYVKTKDGKVKEKRDLFFSTDTQQTAQDILDIYQARFQIEFCFREKSPQQQVLTGHQRYEDNGFHPPNPQAPRLQRTPQDLEGEKLPPVEDSLLNNSQAYLIVNPVKKQPLTFTGIWLSLPSISLGLSSFCIILASLKPSPLVWRMLSVGLTMNSSQKRFFASCLLVRLSLILNIAWILF
jgi:hypothetical protein